MTDETKMSNSQFTKDELNLIETVVRSALDNSEGSCPFDGTEIEDIIHEGPTRNTACDIMYKLTGNSYYARSEGGTEIAPRPSIDQSSPGTLFHEPAAGPAGERAIRNQDNLPDGHCTEQERSDGEWLLYRRYGDFDEFLADVFHAVPPAGDCVYTYLPEAGWFEDDSISPPSDMRSQYMGEHFEVIEPRTMVEQLRSNVAVEHHSRFFETFPGGWPKERE